MENQLIICLPERYKDCIEEWFQKKNVLLSEINFGKTIVMNGNKYVFKLFVMYSFYV